MYCPRQTQRTVPETFFPQKTTFETWVNSKGDTKDKGFVNIKFYSRTFIIRNHTTFRDLLLLWTFGNGSPGTENQILEQNFEAFSPKEGIKVDRNVSTSNQMSGLRLNKNNCLRPRAVSLFKFSCSLASYPFLCEESCLQADTGCTERF